MRTVEIGQAKRPVTRRTVATPTPVVAASKERRESLGRGVLVLEIPDICRVSAGGTLGDIVHESLGHEVPTVIHLAD